MEPAIPPTAASAPSLEGRRARADLFRLLGDEDRLQLLALCAQDELAVGELAELLQTSQPQVSKKAQPLRQAGLLAARKDGTRTLLKTTPSDDAVVLAALEEGRALCRHDGSLSRVAAVVLAREEQGQQYFAAASVSPDAPPPPSDAALSLLGVVAPLLGRRGLVVDVGTGEGALLPVLSPLFARVVGVDRSAARLARCAARVAALGLDNVRLFEGSAFEGSAVHEEVARLGLADVVVCARVLHHAARPGDAVAACARLLKPGGRLLVLDYEPHDDEGQRAQGDVWLGFAPDQLRGFLSAAGLVPDVVAPLSLRLPDNEPDAHLPFQLAAGARPLA